MIIKIVDKKVTFPKDCTICSHSEVCKFLEEQTKLAHTILMYSMTEFAESNNVLSVFKEHTRCKHYHVNWAKHNVPSEENTPVTLEHNKQVIYNIISHELKLRGINMLSSQYLIEEDKAKITTSYSPTVTKEFIISDLIKGYTF